MNANATGFLLAVALPFCVAMVDGHEQRIQPTRPGKKETLSAEQKKRLLESSQRASELRKTERPQQLNQMRMLEQKFQLGERQKLAKDNAAIRAEINALRSPSSDARYDAIEREARELWRRAQTATAAEREAIDRRAAQLLRQLRGKRVD